MNYVFVEDLKKYPRVMEYLRQKRQDNLKETILFFERGVEQGLFRTDLDMALVIQLMQLLNEQVTRNDLGRVYPMEQLFRSVVLIFIRGISTDKGLRLLEEMIERHDKKKHEQTNL